MVPSKSLQSPILSKNKFSGNQGYSRFHHQAEQQMGINPTISLSHLASDWGSSPSINMTASVTCMHDQRLDKKGMIKIEYSAKNLPSFNKDHNHHQIEQEN